MPLVVPPTRNHDSEKPNSSADYFWASRITPLGERRSSVTGIGVKSSKTISFPVMDSMGLNYVPENEGRLHP